MVIRFLEQGGKKTVYIGTTRPAGRWAHLPMVIEMHSSASIMEESRRPKSRRLCSGQSLAFLRRLLRGDVTRVFVDPVEASGAGEEVFLLSERGVCGRDWSSLPGDDVGNTFPC